MTTLIPTKEELIDLGLRSFWTFIQSFSGFGLLITMLAGTGQIDLHQLGLVVVLAAGAGLSAVLALVKTFASNRLGMGTTVVPPKEDPPTV